MRIAKEGRDSLAVLDSHLGHAVAIPVLGWYVPALHLQGHTLMAQATERPHVPPVLYPES